jgi:beta-lactamase regulating signal transducer with metallopeptidase domain/peroxiredoxin/protocatechuate 3,4-dioxygenase beta subunit
MIGNLISLGGWDGASVIFGLDVALKAAVLLLAAGLAHLGLGRRRVLARSAVWNACLLGLLALPIAGAALPRLRLLVPAAPAPTPRAASTSATPVRSPAPVAPRAINFDRAEPAPPADVAPVAWTPAVPRTRASTDPPPRVPAWVTTALPGWPRLLVAGYAAGAVLLLVRLAIALAGIEALRRGGLPVADRAWREGMGRARQRLGVARPIELLTSPRVTVPVALGALRPAIVLPRSIVAMASPQAIEAILLHELVHIRRADYAWNLVRRAVGALYWPHPLTWPLGRVIGRVREQACDDYCVRALGGRESYRETLLHVASGLVRRPGPALGLAMARSTRLGQRLAWIERSRGLSSCRLRWPWRLGIAAVVMVLAGTLGTIELRRAQATPAQAKDEPKPAAKEAVRDEKADRLGPDLVDVTVKAADTGRPIEGASIRVSADFENILLKTDRDGRSRVDRTGMVFRETLHLDIWADGYIQQRYSFSQEDGRDPRIPETFTVELLPGEETLGGKVVDEEGRPIAGVKVEIWGYLGAKKEEHELCYMVSATTDERGEWRGRSFRAMTFAYLYLSHPDYISDNDSSPRAHGQPRPSDSPQPGEKSMDSLRDFSNVQVMKRGVEVSGRVVDAQGRPVPGAEVGWIAADRQRTALHDGVATTATDDGGHFRIPNALEGRIAIQVKAKGHAPELRSLTAKAGAEPVTIELRPARTLAGRVVDTQGRPIPGAFVSVAAWRGYRSLGIYLKADADGRFRWEDAPSDPVYLNVGQDGYKFITQRPATPDDGEVVLTLKRSLRIAGDVLDAETGEKIDRMDLRVGTTDPKTGEIAWRQSDTVSGSQGDFRAVLDADMPAEYRLRFTARGYQPFESRVFRSDERDVRYDVKLKKSDRPQGEVVSGVVRRPDGTPLSDAVVAVTYPLNGVTYLPGVQIENGAIRRDEANPTVKTDAQGRFSITREPDPDGQYFALVIVHPDFCALVPRAELEAGSAITVVPWGRVEGIARVGAKPAAGAAIRRFANRLLNRDVARVYDEGETTAGADGRFVLDRVLPGDVRVSFAGGTDPNASDWKGSSNGTLVFVRAGETARADVGGRGRPVIARIAPPEGFDPKADYAAYSEFEIESDRPHIPYPKEILAKRDESMETWAKGWWASDEGHEYRRNWFHYGQAKLQPDGTIRAEDVPPGEYRLRLTFSADPIRGPGGAGLDRVAFATRQFTIPPIPGGRSDEPFDLGVLHPKLKATLKVGQTAPDFAVPTLDGKRLTLADFRGKYVLLDFWATWCGPCIAELPEMQAVWEKHGRDERFAMLSLSLDAEEEAPRKFVAEKNLPWLQGFLGEWAEAGMTDAYHIESIPAVFLVGPDGKLVAQGLRGDAIGQAVASALKREE